MVHIFEPVEPLLRLPLWGAKYLFTDLNTYLNDRNDKITTEIIIHGLDILSNFIYILDAAGKGIMLNFLLASQSFNFFMSVML